VTDRFILKHGLEQVFLYFLYKIPGPLKIGITTREQQLSLILPPLSDSIVASLEALEASLRSLLTTAALSPSLHWDQDIYSYSFAPIGESQVMAA
jgi:hypothetical protein